VNLGFSTFPAESTAKIRFIFRTVTLLSLFTLEIIMRKTAANTYKCVEGELVQIRFFCNPSRENVNIRRSFDGKNFITVSTNSIQFVMGSGNITLTLQYAFILGGTCLNQILVVDNSPTGDDRITASASGGGTDLLTFRFRL
jgi:hypothetical protein